MNYIELRIELVRIIKKVFRIKNFTRYLNKKKTQLEKLCYYKKYTSDDVILYLRQMGVKPGRPLIVHSSMSNLYNYQGTADELIDKLLDYLGPEGTLCMPAFPHDKYNQKQIFDVRNTPSAAGYLTEVFRKRPGVKRSMNHLHSVCALGKDADLITGSHHLSRICFDEKSPFFIIGELNGYSVNLGLPKWFTGTGAHVCEALLYEKLPYFKQKFSKEIYYSYIDYEGKQFSAPSLTIPKQHFVRNKTTKIFDSYFDKEKYQRMRLSNIWITVYDMNYLYTRLSELALEGVTIYRNPPFIYK